MTEPLPAPPVPADADVRGLPYLPLDVVRLLDSDLMALSTGDEFKAAVSLWCRAWNQVPAGSLPDDDRVLAHLSGAGPKWKRVKDMALRGWTMRSDGRLHHDTVGAKAAEAWMHRQSQRARATKRWQPRESETGSATAMPRHNHGSTTVQATPHPTAMQGSVKGTLREDKKEEDPTPERVSVAVRAPAPARPKPAAEKCACPPDWQPSPDMRSKLETKGYTPDEIAWQSDRFAAYWSARTDKRPGWDASFFQWVTREPPGKARPAGSRPGYGNGRQSLTAAVGALLASLPDPNDHRC